MNDKNYEWIRIMKERGHDPIMDEDGELNVFVCDEGYHNGPGCATCGESWCYHCVSAESIGLCDKPVIVLIAEPELKLLAE